jgi:preprotein translocase subunit SecA
MTRAARTGIPTNNCNAFRYHRQVNAINALRADMERRTDAQLTAFSGHLRRRHLDGESLDSLLVEAFALVREASRRKLGKVHYDVQLIGGMVLHEGAVAEMATGMPSRNDCSSGSW